MNIKKNNTQLINSERTEAIINAQVTCLYEQLPRVIVFSVATLVFIDTMFWNYVSTERILGWTAAVLLMLLGRVYIYGKYRFHKGNLIDKKRRREFLLFSALSGAVWGSSAIVLFVDVHHTELHAMLLLTLAGMGAVSIAFLPMYLPAFYLYFPITILPMGIMLLIQGGEFNALMAAFAIIYTAGLTSFGTNIGRTLKHSLELQYDYLALTKKLKTQKETAEQANLAKSRFLAAASHDLRQPMQALSLFSDVLSRQVVDEKDKKLTKNICITVTDLTKLFDALLDISRLDAGIVKSNIQVFPAKELFDQVTNDYIPLAVEKGLTFTYKSCPVLLKSDKALLERIVRNLVSNALRYTLKGTVVLDWEVTQGGIMILVIDTGVGIPDDAQQLVFEEFFQLENPERDQKKGQGLGLSIVYRLAELLVYPIDLVSVPGVGTQFSITVPTVTKMEVLPVTKSKTFESSLAEELVGLNVYVLDDHAEIRESMVQLLKSWGCIPRISATMSELYEMLGSGESLPDAMIIDYRLPGIDTGINIINYVHSRYSPDIRALLITGDDSVDGTEVLSGDFSVLFKPVEPARLRAWLSSSIRRGKGSQE